MKALVTLGDGGNFSFVKAILKMRLFVHSYQICRLK